MDSKQFIIEWLPKATKEMSFSEIIEQVEGEDPIEASRTLVETVLSTGNNWNLRDVEGATILEVAAGFGHTDLLKRMLDQGADLNMEHPRFLRFVVKDCTREVLEQVLKAKPKLDGFDEPILLSAANADEETLERFNDLLRAGAPLVDGGVNALLSVLITSFDVQLLRRVIQLLLDPNVDENAKCVFGNLNIPILSPEFPQERLEAAMEDVSQLLAVKNEISKDVPHRLQKVDLAPLSDAELRFLRRILAEGGDDSSFSISFSSEDLASWTEADRTTMRALLGNDFLDSTKTNKEASKSQIVGRELLLRQVRSVDGFQGIVEPVDEPVEYSGVGKVNCPTNEFLEFLNQVETPRPFPEEGVFVATVPTLSGWNQELAVTFLQRVFGPDVKLDQVMVDVKGHEQHFPGSRTTSEHDNRNTRVHFFTGLERKLVAMLVGENELVFRGVPQPKTVALGDNLVFVTPFERKLFRVAPQIYLEVCTGAKANPFGDSWADWLGPDILTSTRLGCLPQQLLEEIFALADGRPKPEPMRKESVTSFKLIVGSKAELIALCSRVRVRRYNKRVSPGDLRIGPFPAENFLDNTNKSLAPLLFLSIFAWNKYRGGFDTIVVNHIDRDDGEFFKCWTNTKVPLNHKDLGFSTQTVLDLMRDSQSS